MKFTNRTFTIIAFYFVVFTHTGENKNMSVISIEKKSKGSIKGDDNAKSNLIFYLADDQDIYDYGCYGNDKINTPAVDRLAKEGMLFENAFTAQAICAPSRSQLYSGNYPVKNGCCMNHVRVKNNIKSVGQYMGELGYEVILAGKSHVKPAKVFNWDKEWASEYKEGTPRKYIPLDSIQNYLKHADKPFCMFIASAYPHGEYYNVEGKTSDDIKFFPFNESKKNDPATIKSKAGYYKNVEEDNKQLELVLNWVDKFQAKNILFIYSADHGVSGKYSVYDRGLNVPFVVRWPGVIKAGSRSDALIHYTDVLPTFMDVTGARVPEHLDGKSFLPILKGDMSGIHKYVYGVQTNQGILNAHIFPARMIRSKKYKYIRNFNSYEVMEQNYGSNMYVNAFIKRGALKHTNTPYEELYDVEADPFEQNNLANMPELSNIKAQLATDLLLWMKNQGDFLTGEPGYMPIIKTKFKLDKSSKYITLPDSLKNSLKQEDYLNLHF